MTTKTKPKKPITPVMTVIKLSARDESEILNILGLQKAATEERKALVNALERDLTFGFNKLNRVAEKPFPEHTLAELEPIADAAGKLKELLYLPGLTIEVQKLLNLHRAGHYESLHVNITELADDARAAIQQIRAASTKGHGGKLKQRQSDALAFIKDALNLFFDRNVSGLKPDRAKKYRAGFLKICLEYAKYRARKKSQPIRAKPPASKKGR